ncbi:MAG: endoglucanase [Flavobacteriales bacterium]|jgi:endoglucanase
MKNTPRSLIGLTKALLCGLLLSVMLGSTAQAQYVHTNGTKIVDENGDELFLSGINLGNWLLWEGYLMMGDFNFRTHTQFFNSLSATFGSSDKAAEFEYQWRLNYVDEQAIADLKGLGFNSVRVPFHYNMFWWDGQLRDNGFEHFDNVIEWCRTHDMYVLLDMHAAPGYQNPGDHADNVNSNSGQPRDSVKFWDGNNIQIASDVWRHIADRYKNEPVVWGYDLINEPVPQPGREYELLPSMVQMRNAIREVDNNHIIVVEGNWWSSDLTKIDWADSQVQATSGISSKWDNNLVYQLHHYGSLADTLGRENITNNLNIPLIIGEYGETDNGNLKDITDWARQNLAGYFPWSFKKMSHDKTLWTIPPNDAYNQVKQFINNGGTPPTHLYADMIAFTQNNIRNGHSSHTWHQGFYDAVKPTEVSTPPPEASCNNASAQNLPGRIQAESYCEMFGIQTETTGDVDGDQNIGWIDAGDWTDYKVNITSAGDYTFNARVAANANAGTINVAIDGSQVGSINAPVTGAYQTYLTSNTSVYLPAGVHTLRLDFASAGLNVNWIELIQNSTPPAGVCDGNSQTLPSKVEAEDFCDMSGIQIESTSDTGGGENIGWIDTGDWADYSIHVDTNTNFTLGLRVASQNGGGRVNVNIDGANVGGFDISSTGDWQTWQTLLMPITLNAGDHSLRLDFAAGGLNLNWVEFSTTTTPPVSGELQAGTYYITSEASGKVLDVDGVSTSSGANVHQWAYGGGLNQQWNAQHVTGNTFELVSLNSGACLDADSGSDNAQQWECLGNTNQQWVIEAQTDGSFLVRTKTGNEVLDVQDGNTVNGTNVRTTGLNNSSAQKWRFNRVN